MINLGMGWKMKAETPLRSVVHLWSILSINKDSSLPTWSQGLIKHSIILKKFTYKCTKSGSVPFVLKTSIRIHWKFVWIYHIINILTSYCPVLSEAHLKFYHRKLNGSSIVIRYTKWKIQVTSSPLLWLFKLCSALMYNITALHCFTMSISRFVFMCFHHIKFHLLLKYAYYSCISDISRQGKERFSGT